MRKVKLFKTASWISALIVLYALLGFYVAPLILKPIIEEKLNETLNGNASLQDLHVNPFSLTLTLDNFLIKNAEEKEVLAFRELIVDMSSRSLREWAPTFSAVRLVEPIITLGKNRDGKLNFADLFKSKASDEAPESESSSVPLLIFDKIELIDGHVKYFDEKQNKAFEYELTPLKLEFLNFRSQSENGSTFAIAAQNEIGNSLSINGELRLNPLNISGNINLELEKPGDLFNYLVSDLNLRAKNGRLNLMSQYEWSTAKDSAELHLKTDKFEFADLELSGFEDSRAIVFSKNLSLTLDLSLKNQELSIKDLKADSGALNLIRRADGHINIANFGSPVNPSNSSEENGKSWNVKIDDAVLSSFSVSYLDEGTKDLPEVSASDVTVNLKHFSLAGAGKLEGDLKGKMAGGGQISTTLSASLYPANYKSDLIIENANLKELFQQVDPVLSERLQSGTASMRINAQIPGEKSSVATMHGIVDVKDFAITDKSQKIKVIGWKELNAAEVTLDVSPNRLTAGPVRVTNPELSIRIPKEGAIDLLELGRPSPDVQASEQSATSFDYKIQKIVVSNGVLNFRDESLAPAFRGILTKIDGQVADIKAGREHDMPLNINATINGDGTVDYKGHLVMPSQFPLQNGTMKIRDLNLGMLSAYSLKFLGRAVERGKLHADLKSDVKNNVIHGDNKITLDRLRLGKKTQPPLTDLPVKTALSILSNSDGQIFMDLPIQGDIKEAGLNYRGLLLDGFENLILDVVASPISILASIYNFSDRELSQVEFKPESKLLADGEIKKLAVIKDALQEKSVLRLEIRGGVTPTLDGEDGSSMEISEEMFDLANTRADEIRNLILKDSKIEHSRIYILAPRITEPSAEKTIPSRLVLRSD